LASHGLRKHRQDTARFALIVNSGTTKKNAERDYVHGNLLEQKEQVFSHARDVSDQPEECQKKHPQQEHKDRPALLADKIESDQQHRLHRRPSVCGGWESAVTSRKTCSNDRRTGLTLMISPPNSQTRCITPR